MKERLQEAVKVLHQGGVVAHATETCYGLAVDVFNRKGIQALYALKKMPFTKPVTLLVRDLDEAQQYGEFSTTALKLALQYWPGPLTLVVPRKNTLPQWINPGEKTVGFRVSSNKKAKELVEAFGAPLSTTSANISGLAQAYSIQEMEAQGLKPDFILDSGKLGEQSPSTVVEVLSEATRVIRQGSLQI
ncbi:MAG: L-threonylcarbamoyladenylate synthase [Patescibacteria group bacterium]